MAEAELRRNNMLKEKVVVLEYRINHLGLLFTPPTSSIIFINLQFIGCPQTCVNNMVCFGLEKLHLDHSFVDMLMSQ